MTTECLCPVIMLGAEIVIIQETDSIITVTTNRINNLGIFADNAGSARSYPFRGEGGRRAGSARRSGLMLSQHSCTSRR